MRLGVYELIEPLGVGAMASVWAGRDSGGGRVAIKVAQAHVAADPRLLRLAHEEIRAMARLDHPHIPWVHGWGQVPPGMDLPVGAPWLAIDHCSGGSLADHPPPGFRQVARTLASLLDALAHAHARRVIHGDVKPANVLRATSADERRGVMLADFGLAHVLGSSAATFAGSPSYMAPERIAGQSDRVGPWSDLFSVGALAHELVCRRPAYDGETVEEVLAAVQSGERSAYRPVFDTPPRFAAWIDALLEPDPERRTRRAVAAWRALCRIAPGIPEPSAERVVPRTSGPLRGGSVQGGRLSERPAPFVGREEPL
ncbi:MAG: serine/threonine protein kinase, partial [Myxococcales bacterium]|nr:serine/threonine protein kinase [Myxococcales bacterium]